jgi:hypothetical protein
MISELPPAYRGFVAGVSSIISTNAPAAIFAGISPSAHRASNSGRGIIGTMDLIPIQRITLELIRERVNAALYPRFTPDVIADFNASVDWSGKLTSSPIEKLLGRLSHWDTEFAEKDLSEEDYKERLRSVLTGSYPVAV